MGASSDLPGLGWGELIEELAARVADQLAPRLAEQLGDGQGLGPWLTTPEAINTRAYRRGPFASSPRAGRFPPMEAVPRSSIGPRLTRRCFHRLDSLRTPVG